MEHIHHAYVIEEFNTYDYQSFIVGIFSTFELAKQCFDNSLINRCQDEDCTIYWQIFEFDLDVNHYVKCNRKLLLTTFNCTNQTSG